jgi:hypothetical protein
MLHQRHREHAAGEPALHQLHLHHGRGEHPALPDCLDDYPETCSE